jgi:hypothetical protein
VANKFEETLKNPDLKKRYYPELGAYEWVLDKTLTDAATKPGLVVKLVVLIIKSLENFLKSISGPKKELG